MSNRYAPIANSNTNLDQDIELNAAFDNSDDEEEEQGESHPLHPTPPSPIRPSIPGTYDFEGSDFDYTQPPPGSPPPPSSAALPNEHGNSNGVIPSFDSAFSAAQPRTGWLSQLGSRLGLGPRRPAGVVGAGINNDGVFANVTAKPQRAQTAQSADGSVYLVPEETQGDVPPSYAEASRDAVPQYWETTIHAPFSSDSMGEMIVEGLATGSFFAFLWNMLVSISFQFVGFLLTYLLHTSHAARLGSRAGLGVTLIQYGFALKGKLLAQEQEQQNAYDVWASDDAAAPRPIFETASEAADWFASHNTTNPTVQEAQMVADATTEWLSFFLMTIGWFVLLTSVLGFWRVKRYEASIISSQALPTTAAAVPSTPTTAPSSSFLRNFNIQALSGSSLFRHGMALSSDWGDSPGARARARERAQDSEEGDGDNDEESPMLGSTMTAAQLQLIRDERRLQRDLAAAGLI